MTTDLLPTDEDVRFYREHGWYVSREGLIPADVIAAAERGQERLYDGDVDAVIPGREGEGWQPAHGDGVLRKNDYASLMVRELAAVVRYPPIAAVAARLSSAASIRLWHDQLLYKPPETEGRAPNVGWHTDRQYWLMCSSDEMLTAWVPFHDCDESMGTLEFVDGSHRWRGDGAALDFFSGDLETQEAALERAGLSVRKVPARLKRGQASFHNCRTIHGSGPNRSGEPRRSIAIHLQPGDNRHVERRLENGELARHSLDDLTRDADGTPDYANPRFCPTLYPAGSVRPS